MDDTREILEITEQTLESKVDAELASIPPTPNNYFWKGYDFYQRSRYREAIYAFTKATELGDLGAHEVEAYFFRGKCHAVFNEDDHAVADYTRALKADPNYVHAYKERAFVYGSSQKCPNYELAIRDAEHALELNTKKSPQFLLDIARIYSGASRAAPPDERSAILGRAKNLLTTALERGLDRETIEGLSKDKYKSLGPLGKLPEVQSLLQKREEALPRN